VPGAINLPLTLLRQRHHEIPADADVWVYCQVGQRAYYATRLLLQHGHRVRNLSGGIQTWRAVRQVSRKVRETDPAASDPGRKTP
jgi:rhodanese-related sulfurtransferase